MPGWVRWSDAPGLNHHVYSTELIMGKSQDAKKDTKKAPAKSAKEKKAEKLEKKAGKKY
jgi:hypothetical protein